MRLALFASGGGSNAAEILDRAAELGVEPALLVSDRPRARALDRATARGVPTAVIAPADHADEAAFGEALVDALARAEVQAIVLAGYLKKLPASLVWAYRDKILNVHPSLLPAFGGPGFYGEHVHRAVLERGCKVSGATVHLVTAEVDAGPIVLQQAVDVLPGDSPETLAARVLAVEHEILPRAVGLLAAGRLRVADGVVEVL